MLSLIVGLIVVLVVVGVLMWLVNTYAARFMSPAILQVLNVAVVVVVVVCVLYWLLAAFGLLGPVTGGGPPIPKLR
jgi:hypothetical protein